jgi:hypothetical protein
MTTQLVTMILVALMTGAAMAEGPKVTELMTKALAEHPGRKWR